jgi:putative PEP-CTERM system histidine kinase
MTDHNIVLANGLALMAIVAAIGFGALALVTIARGSALPLRPQVFALLATACWLVLLGLVGNASPIAWIAESVRNIAWLWFMAAIVGTRDDGKRIGPVGWIYIGLFALQAVMASLLIAVVAAGNDHAPYSRHFDIVQMLFAAGVLVLLHNLVEAALADERRGLILPLGGLAALWMFDLNLYAIGYLGGEPASLLHALRPAAAAAVLLVMGVAALRPAGHAVRLSRPVAFRSLAVAAIAGWLLLLAIVSGLMGGVDGQFAARAQVALLSVSTAAVASLFLSARLRALLRVWTVKHFFEHRYDYRIEWLRFTATLNRPADKALSIDARVVKAMADIVESSGGALIAPDGAMVAEWPKGALLLPPRLDWADFGRWLSASERIVQLDEVRQGRAPAEEIAATPAGIIAQESLWIAVPLIHMGEVEGLVLLGRPMFDRALDWEDFDLLKVAARQASSHLAQARGAEALAEGVRFDEFHRRFAFMMHDVKNLASQMALLARNAERHGDNPDFREDMVATLRFSADRLSQMMQRLAQQERVRVERIESVDLDVVARRVAALKASLHRIEIVGASTASARGDSEMVEQLLVHLVQNAIDASHNGHPVELILGGDTACVTLTVADKGSGMSPEFIRSHLFRPFNSTKEGGFGIGAYQARQLAEAMGGTLCVESREGVGTSFILSLARSDSIAAQTALPPAESHAA